jgi:hypothetical protein
MPDGDVYDRHGMRGWKKASSWIVGAGNFDDGIPSALRALGREIKTTGCPGIDQIVGTVVDAFQPCDQMGAKQQAIERLEQIRIQYGSRATEIAIRSSKSLIVETFELDRSKFSSFDDGNLRTDITVHILADLSDACLCPSGVLTGLVEDSRLSFQEVHSRRERAKQIVAAAPETRRLAIQLLANPSGAQVKTPRFRREKLSQSEILATPLTV